MCNVQLVKCIIYNYPDTMDAMNCNGNALSLYVYNACLKSKLSHCSNKTNPMLSFFQSFPYSAGRTHSNTNSESQVNQEFEKKLWHSSSSILQLPLHTQHKNNVILQKQGSTTHLTWRISCSRMSTGCFHCRHAIIRLLLKKRALFLF